MRFCTTFVFQRGGPLTFEKLQSINEEERKKTLGYFLDQIRRRSKLHPKLAENLKKYLDMRNDIVHNHSKIEGWNLRTEEGVAVANTYLWSFIRLGNHLLEVFAALSIEWEQQVGFNVTLEPEAESYIRGIQDKYGHLVNGFFGYDDSDS